MFFVGPVRAFTPSCSFGVTLERYPEEIGRVRPAGAWAWAGVRCCAHSGSAGHGSLTGHLSVGCPLRYYFILRPRLECSSLVVSRMHAVSQKKTLCYPYFSSNGHEGRVPLWTLVHILVQFTLPGGTSITGGCRPCPFVPTSVDLSPTSVNLTL